MDITLRQGKGSAGLRPCHASLFLLLTPRGNGFMIHVLMSDSACEPMLWFRRRFFSKTISSES